MTRYKKPMRRATEKELAWVRDLLASGLETNDFMFSIEKMLKWRILLHVKCEGEVVGVYLNFVTGRFSRPFELEQ
ncbi:hypothetical protein [Exiguobacterium sp. s21]|uniref:hypothetical protein n=1 Tax=Exiguobacterium sp. s21 TaxID=2751244 RepID=UPI001BEB3D30|nr:hypothetical protein [Exiguobacterium sp. s21]